MAITNEQVIEKIKKALALANNNPNENEARAALLMAQKLMAKYNVSVEMTEDEEVISYAQEKCVHRYDAAYRKPLAAVIARNFRCEFFYHGSEVVFFGRAFDARVAKEAFEYAYEFAMREGNKLERKAYEERGTARGVHSSYTAGFIAGLKEALEAQCTALMIVTPQDVKDEFADMSAGWKAARGGFKVNFRDIDRDAYRAGHHDGKTVMNGRRVEE